MGRGRGFSKSGREKRGWAGCGALGLVFDGVDGSWDWRRRRAQDTGVYGVLGKDGQGGRACCVGEYCRAAGGLGREGEGKGR